MTRLLPALAASLGLGLVGCATTPGTKYLAAGFVPPATVAVLPLANESKDVDAPDIARAQFQTQIQGRGYQTPLEGEVDVKLNAALHTVDGNQLKDVDAVKLGGILGVDAVVYGAVLRSDAVNLVAYKSRNVEFAFRMVDARSGKTLWSQRKKASDHDVALKADEFAVAALKTLAGTNPALAAKLGMDSPDLAVPSKAVRWCLASLPRRGAAPRENDDSTSYHHSQTEVIEEESSQK